LILSLGGGIGWTGPTACISGSGCTYSNAYYSQCLPSSGDGGESSPTGKPSGNYNNPIIYSDFADNDVSMGPDGAYYYSSSTMAYSPGAPILRSEDLINWEFIGHAVPTLSWGENYDLIGGNAYVEGIWASTLRYRKSTALWYWMGCIQFATSYVYTSPSVTGPWTQAASIDTCFYDCGLLIDDDDNLYIVYGQTNVSISQLASDGLSIVKTQPVFNAPSGYSFIEGNRLYKRNGIYYVLDLAPSQSTTLVWQSKSVWGPWTSKILQQNVPEPAVPNGGAPQQGSLVETPSGNWYFIAVTASAYPVGRIPVMAPITWGSDGFPVLTTVNGTWGVSYPNPLPTVSTPSWLGTDSFSGTTLAPHWEWNHNPDTTKFTVNNGLTLSTATVTSDLYSARNTLTIRVYNPVSVGTVVLDITNMADGDHCGLAAFRDWTAYIGISRSNSTYTISMVEGVILSAGTNGWSTTSSGNTSASATVSEGKIWLRGTMQTAPSSSHSVSFQYSTDGMNYIDLGVSYVLNQDYTFFMGYRWGIFNFALKELGGSILALSFEES
jgi:beta-xylosidase